MYNKVAEQIKNISAPIHEKIVSKFNKIDFDTIDVEGVWEVIYLIMLAFYVGVNVLTSTMFEIAWPAYFFQTFRSVCVTLVIIRLIIIKEIPKKKFIAMVVISFVFLMSHYMSGYGLPIDLLILVLGAYNVDFRKILKTYIAVWSVLLVITIIGAMTGLAENLVYYQGEGGERVRMALGMNYPTDLAAYVAFLMFAYVCVRDEYITYLEIGVMAVLAVAVFYITDARTDFIVMMLLLITVTTTKVLNSKIEKIMDKSQVKTACMIFPAVMCILVYVLSANFSYDNQILSAIDEKMSGRLALGRWALMDYKPSAFGRYVIEKGAGGSTTNEDFYFFIDSSYLSIGIKYGIMFLIIMWWNFIEVIKKIWNKKSCYMIICIMMVLIQSVMEHHYIQYWFNPFLIAMFAMFDKEEKNTSINSYAIEDLN